MADVYVNTEGFRELLSKLDELPKAVYRDMGYTILLVTLMVETTAKQNIAKNFHGKGTMASSLTHKILKVAGLSVTGVVGTNLVYAPVHEFGMTITPKNVDWLTIPFADVTGRAHDYERTFFAWTKNRHLVLFQNRGFGLPPKPLFALVKKSEIPARPWLNPALMVNKDRAIELINAALNRSLALVSRK